MPSTKVVPTAKAVPPVAAAYHWIPVPVAVRSPTVGVSIEQNDCEADPVGADGFKIVIWVIAVILSIGSPVVPPYSTT